MRHSYHYQRDIRNVGGGGLASGGSFGSAEEISTIFHLIWCVGVLTPHTSGAIGSRYHFTRHYIPGTSKDEDLLTA